MYLLLLFFAFSQTVTTSPLITNFEELWRQNISSDVVSKTEISSWVNQMWERANFKTPADKLKEKESQKYQLDELHRKIVALQSKGVDNSEAIKELVRTYIMLQEARIRYNLDPTSSDLYLAIDRYNKMYTSFDTAIFSYDREGKYKKGWFDGAFDIAKLKSEFAGGWTYDVRHRSYVTPDVPSDFDMPSDGDLMAYNKAYCQCVFVQKKIAIKARRDCAAETVDTSRSCDLFADPGEQPKASRIKDCGSGKVFIFPYATSYFINTSCTLDLARAKAFLLQNSPRSKSGSGAR